MIGRRGLDFGGCGASVSGVLGCFCCCCCCCCCNMSCGGCVIGCRGRGLVAGGCGAVVDVDVVDLESKSCKNGDVNGGYAVILWSI